MSNSPRANPLDLDLSEFEVSTTPVTRPRPEVAAVRAVSEQHKFPSREAKPKVPNADEGHPTRRQGRMRRVYRTGRNQQFNMKASPEAIERFYQLTERQGWVLGETLEHALDALEAKLATDS